MFRSVRVWKDSSRQGQHPEQAVLTATGNLGRDMLIEEKKFPYPCRWDSGKLICTERKPTVVKGGQGKIGPRHRTYPLPRNVRYGDICAAPHIHAKAGAEVALEWARPKLDHQTSPRGRAPRKAGPGIGDRHRPTVPRFHGTLEHGVSQKGYFDNGYSLRKVFPSYQR